MSSSCNDVGGLLGDGYVGAATLGNNPTVSPLLAFVVASAPGHWGVLPHTASAAADIGALSSAEEEIVAEETAEAVQSATPRRREERRAHRPQSTSCES